MNWIIALFINAVAFYIGARLLDGVVIRDFIKALIVALVVALLNATLGFVLKIATLGLLGMGLFTLILDAIIIKVADVFLKGFSVKNFWWAIALAFIVAIVNVGLKSILM
ncbi:MAG TPA: phage holin family protein [Saprospiraceae bacterium]|nr:phage holin family protein [Saprospiraceae bacterium]